MSEHNDRGRQFEDKVARLIRAKIDKSAKRNAGSHANWQRRSDIYTQLPLHIEAKDQETIKIKEWFRQADDAAGMKTPVVVYHDDENIMAALRFNDLLDFIAEIADLKFEIEGLRIPPMQTSQPLTKPGIAKTADDTKKQLEHIRPIKVYYCTAGHIANEFNRCLTKGCKFNVSYKPPKKKEDRS